MEDVSTSHPFMGRWEIMVMELSALYILNPKLPPFIEFNRDLLGEFQLGRVHGQIDYRLTERRGQDAVEFTWEGDYEGERVNGRGFAVIDDNSLIGEIYIHKGEDSSFLAHRSE